MVFGTLLRKSRISVFGLVCAFAKRGSWVGAFPTRSWQGMAWHIAVLVGRSGADAVGSVPDCIAAEGNARLLSARMQIFQALSLKWIQSNALLPLSEI